jgi:hypothetical protein
MTSVPSICNAPDLSLLWYYHKGQTRVDSEEKCAELLSVSKCLGSRYRSFCTWDPREGCCPFELDNYQVSKSSISITLFVMRTPKYSLAGPWFGG